MKEESNFIKSSQLKYALLDTRREGISKLSGKLQEIGFFDAPASGGNHENRKGGLCIHSFNVYRNAHRIAQALLSPNDYENMKDSITIVSILHDVGKCGDYGKPLYVPNILKSGKQSDAKPYERNKDLLPTPHAFRSVEITDRYIKLTEDEAFAIRYHDGLYDRETGGMAVIPGHETPLLMILHWADLWASKIDEKEEKGEEV